MKLLLFFSMMCMPYLAYASQESEEHKKEGLVAIVSKEDVAYFIPLIEDTLEDCTNRFNSIPKKLLQRAQATDVTKFEESRKKLERSLKTLKIVLPIPSFAIKHNELGEIVTNHDELLDLYENIVAPLTPCVIVASSETSQSDTASSSSSSSSSNTK